MKNFPFLQKAGLFFFLLSSIFFLAFFVPTTGSHSDYLANVDIQFGRGPNCTSRGICSIDAPSGSLGFSGGNLSPAQLTYDSNNHLVISIYKIDISVSTMQTQFVNGMFEQLESISFTQSNQPEHSPPTTIAAGNYSVVDLGDRYTITF